MNSLFQTFHFAMTQANIIPRNTHPSLPYQKAGWWPKPTAVSFSPRSNCSLLNTKADCGDITHSKKPIDFEYGQDNFSSFDKPRRIIMSRNCSWIAIQILKYQKQKQNENRSVSLTLSQQLQLAQPRVEEISFSIRHNSKWSYFSAKHHEETNVKWL